MKILYQNFSLLLIESGQHPKLHPSLIKPAVKEIQNATEINSNRTNWYANAQINIFIIGCIFYLVWHCYEMYLR
jgi:hypothetical protein